MIFPYDSCFHPTWIRSVMIELIALLCLQIIIRLSNKPCLIPKPKNHLYMYLFELLHSDKLSTKYWGKENLPWRMKIYCSIKYWGKHLCRQHFFVFVDTFPLSSSARIFNPDLLVTLDKATYNWQWVNTGLEGISQHVKGIALDSYL